MARNADVQLTIRAKNEAERTIRSVAEAMALLNDAQTEVAGSAGRTGSRLEQLATGLAGLEAINRKLAASSEASATAISRQAQSLLETNRGIADRQARIAELQRGLQILSVEADKAFIGPRRNGLDAQIKLVTSELKIAQRDLAGFSSTFDRQLSGLRTARESFRTITTAQREAAGAVVAFNAEITAQNQQLELNATAARRAAAAQQFFNNKFAPGLDRPETSAGDQREIASVLRAAEARDIEIQKLREQTAASEALAAAQQRMARARALFQANSTGGRNDAASIDASKTALADLLRAQQATADEMEEMQAQAARLRETLDPLAVIERRLATETARLGQLQKAGVISAREYADGLKLLQADAARAAQAIRGNSGLDSRGRPSLFGLKPYELQNLSFQINDVFTQLASGTSLTQTIAQQGGQILQLFPRVGSAIAAALTSGPLLAFVAVLASVGIGLNRLLKDAEQLRNFEGLLIASGNGAQFQASEIQAATIAIDRYGLSADQAVKLTRLFVREGLDPSRFVEFGMAAKNMADVLGIDVVDAAKQMADGFTGGFEAIERLDKATDAFTESESRRIETLFKAGRAEEARALAFDIASRKYQAAADQARGPWTEATLMFSRAWDTLVRTVSTSGPVELLAQAFNGLAENLLLTAERIERLGLAGAVLRNLRDDPIVRAVLGDAPQEAPQRTQAAAAGANAEASAVLARNAEATQAANERLTAEMRKQRVEAAELTNQSILQQKLDIFRANLLKQLQNDERFKNASDAVVLAQVETTTAAKRVELEKQLSDYLKRQADERARQLKDAKFLTAELLRQQEGFRSRAYWDRNAFRIGFGSDTMTDERGRVSQVTRNSTTTRDAAERDLARRIEEFTNVVRRELGSERFNAFSAQQQAVLTSIAYNYGSLRPTGALDTFRTGTVSEIADAIRGLAGQNGGINRNRRNREADLFDTPNLALEASTQEAAEKKLEAQQKFNDEIDAENLKRQQTIDNAERLQGLQGEALIDAEKIRFVEEAVAAQRAKAAKDQVTFTAQQEQATRALAAAEFEATRGAQARADAARRAADQPVDQLLALRNQLQSDLQTAAAAGQTGRAGDLQTQIAGINAQLRQATESALAFYRALLPGTVAFPGTQAELDAIIAKLNTIQNAAPALGVYFGVAGEQIAQAFAGTASGAVDNFFRLLGEGVNGFEALRQAFLQFAADFLRQIAQMILQQLALNLVSGFLGIGSAPAAHGGGIIGRHMGASRPFHPAWVATAARYHSGGIAGLRPNEVPAVLERGEEVLTRDDPRHMLNGGGAGGSSPNFKIVNVLDGSEVMSQALSTRKGEQSLLNFIRFNRGAVKAAIG